MLRLPFSTGRLGVGGRLASRDKTLRGVSRGRGGQSRQFAIESLEERTLLSVGCRCGGGAVESAGVVAAAAGQLAADGRVIQLVFGGATGVSYDGPVRATDLDIPSFRVTPFLSGGEQEVAAAIIVRLNALFSGEGVHFVTASAGLGQCSTVYVGGTDQAFSRYGSFLGLSEPTTVGEGNQPHEAFVFSDSIALCSATAADFVEGVTAVIAHESGHLLGLSHESPGFLGAVMAEGCAGGESALGELAYKAESHQYATEQALIAVERAFESLYAADSQPWDKSLFTASGRFGSQLVTGSVDEDADPQWMRHFYDPTALVCTGLFCAANANDTAQRYLDEYVWPQYESAWVDEAWHDLGNVVHLLEDMSVPAHVLNDPHPLPGESYETYVESSYASWSVDSGVVAKANKIFESFKTYDLSTGGLSDMFDEVVGITQHYDSDDRDGHSDSTGSRISAPRITTTIAGPFGLTFSISHLDSTALKPFADTLYTNAMAYAAALIEWFVVSQRPELTLTCDTFDDAPFVKLNARPYVDGSPGVGIQEVVFQYFDGSQWNDLSVVTTQQEADSFTYLCNVGELPSPAVKFRARVLDSGGLYSEWEECSLSIPCSPDLYADEEGTSAIHLSWCDPAAATGYTVQRGSSNNGPWTTIYDTPANSCEAVRELEIGGLAANTTYYFRISAKNGAGSSSWSTSSATTDSTPPTKLYAPDSPLCCDAQEAGANEAIVAWHSTPFATSYVLDRSDDGGAWHTVYSGPFVAYFTDGGLQPDTEYEYRATAVNSAGSNYTTDYAYTEAGPDVEAPSHLLASAVNAGMVQVSFAAEPAATSYTIQRSDDYNGWSDFYTGANVTYLDSSVSADTEYSYRVRANRGTEQSDWSDPVSVETPEASPVIVPAPAAPSWLAPTINASAYSSTQVTLKWSPAANAQQYVIERSTTAYGPWEYVSWSAVKDCQYTDWVSSTTSGMYYRVIAVNSTSASLWSDVLCIKTTAAPAISGVVVAEAGTTKNGKLETNEPLKITWAVTSSNSIASQAMTVDGRSITPISGPYSGLYYSCAIGTLSAGSHTYTIKSTDSKGGSSTSSNTFTVVPGSVTPPALSGVVVAEAGTTKNGKLESGEKLKITWTASSASGIASQTMTVDGKTITPISGPFSSLYYSCTIGAYSAGSHTYAIKASNSKGASATSTGTFTVVSPPPPTISGVVVAEAGTTKNGTLESGEKLKITWAASSASGIASQTMTVDGKTITPISGPFSGLYYSCTIGAYSAGSHAYAIKSSDSKGASATSTGTFTVVSPPPPTIGSIVVAEAGTTKNGTLEVNEKLKITWAASSASGIASQTMTVDGKTLTPISGPFSSLYYSCAIGAFSAGSHTYTIKTTDAKGVSASKSGSFTVVVALTAASSPRVDTAADQRASLLTAVMQEIGPCLLRC
jgi:hypothetical protein